MAAGNDGEDACNLGVGGQLPAALANVITVGAHDDNYNVADFSNYGDCVDIFAPGVSVFGAINIPNPTTGAFDQYFAASGTSMATPVISGIITNWLLECDKSGDSSPCEMDMIRERLQDWTVSVSASPDVVNSDQCGSTGIACEAVQYFCGRPLCMSLTYFLHMFTYVMFNF